MNYLFLFGTIILATSNSILLHKRSEGDSKWSDFLFNTVCSFVWIILLTVINKGLPAVSKEVILFGILYGAVQTSFLYFKMKALDTGPIAVTTLTGNCSLLLSTALGVFLWHERVALHQIIGLVLLIVSVFFCSGKINDSAEYSPKWKFFVAGFFLSAGMVGPVFKAFSSTGGNAGDMMIIAAAVMILLNSIILIKTHTPIKGAFKLRREFAFAILCGIVSSLYNRINIYLSGVLPSVIFFPIFNGTIIILSVIAGLIFFKEKITKQQILGFIIGTIAIVMIGIK